jgi:hypothetical protein
MITIDTDTTPDLYESGEELLREPDHIQVAIKVRGWWRRSILIHTLTVPERERILHEAGVGSERNWQTFYEATIREAIIIPHLTSGQVRELVTEHNGEVICELVEYIWQLGRVDPHLWRDYIESR